MLVFWDAGIVLLATPKTGTHALEQALGGAADMAFRHPPRLKHMNLAWATRTLQRLIESPEWDRFRTVAVMREPLDWLGSWYRYRLRDDVRGTAASTRGYSFNEFLRGYMQDDQPPHARLGRQWRFFRGEDGKVGVDHLFAYENFGELVAFLEERLGRRIELDRVNASPQRALDVDPDLAPELAAKLHEDFRLYAALTEGGDWRNI